MSDIASSLERWIKHLGKPTGAGRADPDNDILFLLMDARDEIKRLRAALQEILDIHQSPTAISIVRAALRERGQ